MRRKYQLSDQAPTDPPLSYRMTVYAVCGVLLTSVICVLVTFFYMDATAWSEGKNASNSGGFVLVALVLVFLGAVTLAPLWMDYVHLYYIAFPWYYIFRLFAPDVLAISIGFVVNGGLIGAFVARIKYKKA